MQSLHCNFKTSYPWKGYLSNYGESWFGQPVSRFHILRCFILFWKKQNWIFSTDTLADSQKNLNRYHDGNLNLQLQLQHMINLWDKSNVWPDIQPLFEIKLHKWNQLAESAPAYITKMWTICFHIITLRISCISCKEIPFWIKFMIKAVNCTWQIYISPMLWSKETYSVKLYHITMWYQRWR